MVTEAEDFSEEITLLNGCFSSKYECLVQFGRDEQDNFSCELVNHDESPYTISRGDVRCITPVGQIKNEAFGWRSFFGIPFVIGTDSFIAVGVQKIVKHKPLPGYQSRGYYPKSRAFIFKADDKGLNKIAQGLQTLRSEIANNLADANKPEECVLVERLGSIRKIKSTNPRDHQYEEIKTIDWAVEEYQKPRRSLFRTLAFFQDEMGQNAQDGDSRIVLVPKVTNSPELPPWLEQLENIFFR